MLNFLNFLIPFILFFLLNFITLLFLLPFFLHKSLLLCLPESEFFAAGPSVNYVVPEILDDFDVDADFVDVVGAELFIKSLNWLLILPRVEDHVITTGQNRRALLHDIANRPCNCVPCRFPYGPASINMLTNIKFTKPSRLNHT